MPARPQLYFSRDRLPDTQPTDFRGHDGRWLSKMRKEVKIAASFWRLAINDRQHAVAERFDTTRVNEQHVIRWAVVGDHMIRASVKVGLRPLSVCGNLIVDDPTTRYGCRSAENHKRQVTHPNCGVCRHCFVSARHSWPARTAAFRSRPCWPAAKFAARKMPSKCCSTRSLMAEWEFGVRYRCLPTPLWRTQIFTR